MRVCAKCVGYATRTQQCGICPNSTENIGTAGGGNRTNNGPTSQRNGNTSARGVWGHFERVFACPTRRNPAQTTVHCCNSCAHLQKAVNADPEGTRKRFRAAPNNKPQPSPVPAAALTGPQLRGQGGAAHSDDGGRRLGPRQRSGPRPGARRRRWRRRRTHGFRIHRER